MPSVEIPDDPPEAKTITLQLQRWAAGEPDAFDELLPLVYAELRRIARGQRRRASPSALGDVTSATTDLVHEAFLRFAHKDRQCYAHREHFYAVAAKAMRHILLDQAKRRATAKRGRRPERVALDPERLQLDEQAEFLLALHQSLERLETVSPRAGRVVELRYFGGLTEGETARVLGVDGRTVRRDWAKARLWLAETLGPAGAAVGPVG
ncbi:MAG: ECF-type sigma factor [Acidobacteriota bacterium]